MNIGNSTCRSYRMLWGSQSGLHPPSGGFFALGRLLLDKEPRRHGWKNQMHRSNRLPVGLPGSELGCFLSTGVRVPNSQRLHSSQYYFSVDSIRRRVSEEVNVAAVFDLVNVCQRAFVFVTASQR